MGRERASWTRTAATTDCEAAWLRTLQRLGYDGTTLAIYDEALGDGDLVLHVPVRPKDRSRIVALLQRHGVHDVGYFGPGTFEQFPVLDTG